jgi:hypothetical protein
LWVVTGVNKNTGSVCYVAWMDFVNLAVDSSIAVGATVSNVCWWVRKFVDWTIWQLGWTIRNVYYIVRNIC